MTLSPRNSEPVRHAPVLLLEQNSGDATEYVILTLMANEAQKSRLRLMVEITKVAKSLQVPICGKDSKIEIGYESDIYGTVFELSQHVGWCWSTRK